jgi:hypothetical protein
MNVVKSSLMYIESRFYLVRRAPFYTKRGHRTQVVRRVSKINLAMYGFNALTLEKNRVEAPTIVHIWVLGLLGAIESRTKRYVVSPSQWAEKSPPCRQGLSLRTRGPSLAERDTEHTDEVDLRDLAKLATPSLPLVAQVGEPPKVLAQIFGRCRGVPAVAEVGVEVEVEE